MEANITVSWSFVLPGFEAEPGGANVGHASEAGRDELAPAAQEADRVLPLNSSVVAAGLALFIPA